MGNNKETKKKEEKKPNDQAFKKKIAPKVENVEKKIIPLSKDVTQK